MPLDALDSSIASALMAAAMALPGMVAGADVDDAEIHYSQYQEGGRTYWPGPGGTVRGLAPLRVDSMHGDARLRLTDRLKLAFGFVQDTWSGATPILSAPEAFLTVTGASAYPVSDSRTNRQLVPFGLGPASTRVPQRDIYHMMTAASAETRRQVDVTLSREWDRATTDVAFGTSDEPDFRSRFGRIANAWDFAGKRTTVTASAGYTSSTVDANLGPASAWIDYGLYRQASSGPRIVDQDQGGLTVQRFKGERQDWSAGLSLKQVIDRNTTASLGVSFDRSSGFLENPYKLVMMGFADPATPPVLFGGLWFTRVFNVAENRPHSRAQWAMDARWSHYFAGPDAALQLDYRFAQDDWSIRSHTFETLWSQAIGPDWLVTPRMRYYTQTAADFYQPYFLFALRAPTLPDGHLDFGRLPAQHYSSDHRLSGYGAVSAGVSVTRELSRGLKVEAGAEYYLHGGRLKAGGGGEDVFADYHYWLFNVGLKLDFDGRRARRPGDSFDDPGEENASHHDHAQMPHAHAGHAGTWQPAGLMYGHSTGEKGSLMIAYRFAASRQAGPTIRGDRKAGDAEVTAQACEGTSCSLVPTSMSMQMHMLDIMYGLTDRIDLMIMPQFMDMTMTMRPLAGAIVDASATHSHGGHDRHGSGGLGDTTVAALIRIAGSGSHELHAGLGLSIPTGSTSELMSAGHALDYGMQPGSGTWDVQPSITYNGRTARLFWGAQAMATRRTGGYNDAGYALGDATQLSVWTGYSVGDRLAVSLRGLRSTQGAVRGVRQGTHMTASPPDHPGNYGGRFLDVGVGVNFVVPGFESDAGRLGIEWLEPVRDRFNGYQLERKGNLWVSWSLDF
ncbi:MAG: DUF3570 domain-containing protein [Betaproteobacteria bacterium]|nr:DUF3570 domain-containing protein [Betaproteobacteria bacterium]